MTTFVHLDDVTESNGSIHSFIEDTPNANSTQIEPRIHSHTDLHTAQTSEFYDNTGDLPRSPPQKRIVTTYPGTSYDVGHTSHIPRVPPSQTTFTIPTIEKSMVTRNDHEENLFGMIRLQNNDVCYTSGTIEWVGRKRTYPTNSGFKMLNEEMDGKHQNNQKKSRKLDQTATSKIDKVKECDCADVLPTVNAIVDHLNALHEAVDLVDLRLNTLEDVMSKNVC